MEIKDQVCFIGSILTSVAGGRRDVSKDSSHILMLIFQHVGKFINEKVLKTTEFEKGLNESFT